MSLIEKTKSAIALVALFILFFVFAGPVELVRGLWHELRCEATEREFEWTKGKNGLFAEPVVETRCSECGALQSHPGGV